MCEFFVPSISIDFQYKLLYSIVANLNSHFLPYEKTLGMIKYILFVQHGLKTTKQ